MYEVPHFQENDRRELLRVIREHPLGILISNSAGGAIVANPVPFLVSEDGDRLLAHVARANGHWQNLRDNPEALVVFQGGDRYISPSWYAAKKTSGGKVVPTWNYVHVQVRGTVVIREDAEFLRAQVESLTAQQESGRREPWAVSDAPSEYVEGLLRGIVGIELTIREITGKFKLSQNRPASDLPGILEGLDSEDDGGPSLTDRMRGRGGPSRGIQ
jgi:transcriptional regulator